LHARPQNSSCKIEGRLNSSDLNPVTTKSGNNAAVLRKGSVMSANCSRQSLMKLAPVNGINVCKLVFVSEMAIFSTHLNFWTFIRQVYCSRYYYKHYCHFLTMVKSFVAYISQSHQITFPTFLHYLLSLLHILHKNYVNHRS